MNGFAKGWALAVLLGPGTLAPAWAKSQIELGPQAEPDQTAVETEAVELNWPVPWDQSAELVYHTSSHNRRSDKNGTRSWSASSFARIGSERVEPGYRQMWTGEDYRMGFGEGVDSLMQQTLGAMADMFSGRAVIVELDDEGAFSRLVDIEELGGAYRELLAQAMDTGLENGVKDIEDPGQRSVALATAREKSQSVLAQMGSDEMLAALLSAEISQLLFPGGGDLALDTVYEWEEEGLNMLGGRNLPMLSRLELTLDPDTENKARMDLNRSLDPEKSMPIVIESVERMFGTTLSEEDRAKLGERFDSSVRAEYLIDLETGVVEWMRVTENKKVGDREETEVTVYELRERHPRTDPMSDRASPFPGGEIHPDPNPTGELP